MIWQAIAEDGDVSEPFVTYGTINTEIYLKECIAKQLLPLIEKKKGQRPVLFWPDLATSHYAGVVTERLNDDKINFVTNKDNLPNFPQLRPIEKFWAICKLKYRERNKQADTILKMKRI